ncbi:MAG: hypothetical protein RMK57_01415 [Bryobacterales bacterium]|nr:hypothetical protein [Bryobacterales bacterium]
MPLYTCYDMIRDCAANRPEGWRFFVTEYAPILRTLLEHYRPEAAAEWPAKAPEMLRRFDAAFFAACGPRSERDFLLSLRQQLLAWLEPHDASDPRVWDAFSHALAPLTLTEKQVVWFEVMGYGKDDSAAMMRMHPDGVERIRRKAAEALAQHGGVVDRDCLRSSVAALPADGCCEAKDFFDWLDGRITWYRRDDLERHATHCWRCVDLFCRVREVLRLAQRRKPLSAGEARPLLAALGIPESAPRSWSDRLRFWRRLTRTGA